jgi:hypothetical protein
VTTTTAPPIHERARFPWYVLAGAIVLQGATAPGQTVGVSVFVDHFADDLDLSRSAVSTAYLVGTLSGALTMPAAGRLIDRRACSPRALVVLGASPVLVQVIGASAVGPLIVSLGLDLFGSYTPVLNALGVISVLLAAATSFVSPPSTAP